MYKLVDTSESQPEYVTQRFSVRIIFNSKIYVPAVDLVYLKNSKSFLKNGG